MAALLERLAHAARAAGAAAVDHTADALLVVGASAISRGAWLLHPAAGYAVAGAFCLAAGVLLARGRRED